MNADSAVKKKGRLSENQGAARQVSALYGRILWGARQGERCLGASSSLKAVTRLNLNEIGPSGCGYVADSPRMPDAFVAQQPPKDCTERSLSPTTGRHDFIKISHGRLM